MKNWMALGCLSAMMGAASLAVAQSPFIGTWKMNQAKSHLTGTTMKFSPASNGMIRETQAEGSYTFKTDGQSYPALFGATENWKEMGGHTWQTTVHLKGVLLATDISKLSSDGKTLTVTSEGTRPDGTTFHNTDVYTRLAGGEGLIGTWKSKEVKMSSPGTLEFAANGQNGLTWILPSIKAKLDAKFDGKDYAPTGPTVPDGLTLALTKTGPRSFSMVEKVNGKPMFKGKYTASADGKTLTEVSSPVSVNEQQTVVYDKE